MINYLLSEAYRFFNFTQRRKGAKVLIMNNQKIPKALIDLLRTAQRVVVLTGAGTWA